MNRLRQRLATGTAIAGVSVLVLGALACASGVRINSTRSIPVGLYWLSSEPVGKGAYVMFCPPPIGVSRRPGPGATSGPASVRVGTVT